jgi:hypothetical protein
MKNEQNSYLEFLVHLDTETNCDKWNKLISLLWNVTMIPSLLCNNYLPARTAVPIQESTPERKELNGNDPTMAM